MISPWRDCAPSLVGAFSILLWIVVNNLILDFNVLLKVQPDQTRDVHVGARIISFNVSFDHAAMQATDAGFPHDLHVSSPSCCWCHASPRCRELGRNRAHVSTSGLS